MVMVLIFGSLFFEIHQRNDIRYYQFSIPHITTIGTGIKRVEGGGVYSSWSSLFKRDAGILCPLKPRVRVSTGAADIAPRRISASSSIPLERILFSIIVFEQTIFPFLSFACIPRIHRRRWQVLWTCKSYWRMFISAVCRHPHFYQGII